MSLVGLWEELTIRSQIEQWKDKWRQSELQRRLGAVAQLNALWLRPYCIRASTVGQLWQHWLTLSWLWPTNRGLNSRSVAAHYRTTLRSTADSLSGHSSVGRIATPLDSQPQQWLPKESRNRLNVADSWRQKDLRSEPNREQRNHQRKGREGGVGADRKGLPLDRLSAPTLPSVPSMGHKWLHTICLLTSEGLHSVKWQTIQIRWHQMITRMLFGIWADECTQDWLDRNQDSQYHSSRTYNQTTDKTNHL